MIQSHEKPVALVTGGARRIGAAIAKGLGRQGWAVAVHCNSSVEAAEAVAGEIEDAGGTAAVVAADLFDAQATSALIATTAAALGAPGLLVNNASLFEDDDAASVTVESWDRHLNANLRAPALLARDFAAALPEDATEGNIINLIDQRVWRLTPRFLSYTVSKSGLWTLTQTLAQALAPRIRVNAIGPGPTLCNERQAAEDFQAQLDGTILGRGPDLSEFTQAISFILSARSMTGQMIALDGGQHLAWRTPDIDGIPE